jgi:phage shock protein C
MRRIRRDEYANAPRNRLYRDRENRIIFGVCAGVADYFGFDLKLTRICVAIGAFFFFPTVPIIYVILGLLLDESPYSAREREREENELRRRVRSEPHATLRSVRHRYRELDRRLQHLEKYVTSKKYNLEREIDGLRD